MRYSYAQISRLIDLIYEGGVRVEAWHEFARTLARTMNATFGQLFLWHPVRSEFQFMTNWHENAAIVTPALIETYMAQLRDPDSDPRLTRFYQEELYDMPVHLSRLVPREVVLASPIYRHVMAPVGIEHMLGVSLIDQVNGSALVTAVARKFDDADFDAEDAAFIGELIPHLRRARGLLWTLIDLTMQAETGFAMLDNQPNGIVVMATGAEIVHANAEAQAVIAATPTLTRQGRRLVATGRDAAAFAQALDRLQTASRTGERAMPEVLLFRRGGERKALRMVLAPISPLPTTPGIVLKDRHYVALLLVDPERPIETNVEMLQRLFGLTNAEANVVAGLLRRHDLKEAAADLDISYNTARFHLQRIFEKTETSKQSELIALALDLPMRRRGPAD